MKNSTLLAPKWSYITFLQQNGHQPTIWFVNPARGQLNNENRFIPCPCSRRSFWSREVGLAVPFRVSLLILYTSAESGAYSRDSSPLSQLRKSMALLSRVRRHRVDSPQGSSSNGCCRTNFCATLSSRNHK